jgi:hypothetical protein
MALKISVCIASMVSKSDELFSSALFSGFTVSVLPVSSIEALLANIHENTIIQQQGLQEHDKSELWSHLHMSRNVLEKAYAVCVRERESC